MRALVFTSSVTFQVVFCLPCPSLCPPPVSCWPLQAMLLVVQGTDLRKLLALDAAHLDAAHLALAALAHAPNDITHAVATAGQAALAGILQVSGSCLTGTTCTCTRARFRPLQPLLRPRRTVRLACSLPGSCLPQQASSVRRSCHPSCR